jgi:hypothetical protein
MEPTLDRLLDEGCSLSRFGDGELKLAYRKKSLRFQPVSKSIVQGLADALEIERPGHVPCTNFQFMGQFDWIRLAGYERYATSSGTRISLEKPDDALVLHRKKATLEYRAYWRRVQKASRIPVFGSAGVFFLAFYIEAYRAGRMEEVLGKFRSLFNGRRILFVAPVKPMGGQSFAEQVPLMQQLGLRSAQFITVPDTDAFAETDRVMVEIDGARGFDDIFLQAGPAASVWAHMLAGKFEGRVLDVGSLNTQLRYLQ